MNAGLYFHIPFCRSKCPYCDFFSVAYSEESADKYVAYATLSLEYYAKTTVNTVYFGGGTPSLLTEKQLDSLVSAAEKRFSIAPDAEITAEVNPADCSLSYLRALRSVGVNRLSVGVQSLDDSLLRILGRRHDSATARRALDFAVSAGFDNISADMMTALPSASPEKAAEAAREFCRLPVNHISMYMLKICEGTPFHKRPPDALPDDDLSADIYTAAYRELAENGYERYEISNFTNCNKYSKHNLKYWYCEDYIGVGPGAHSSIGGTRFSIKPDLNEFFAYFEQKNGGKSPKTATIPPFAEFEGNVTAEDYIICSLRTAFGLNRAEMKRLFAYEFPDSANKQIEIMKDGGFITECNGVLKLTDKGFLVQNSVLSRII